MFVANIFEFFNLISLGILFERVDLINYKYLYFLFFLFIIY